MKFTRSKKQKRFYLIATSDIAFLLLIFLVVTSSLEYSQEIQTPATPYTELLSVDTPSVTIEVNAEGTYSILDHEFLASALIATISNISRETVIKIFADKEVEFTTISEIFDILQADNRNKVFLLMEKTTDQ